MQMTDEAGHSLAVTDLNGAELRALRVLAAAGMIPPLDELTASDAQGVLIERDFSRPARQAALKPSVPVATTARPKTAGPSARAS